MSSSGNAYINALKTDYRDTRQIAFGIGHLYDNSEVNPNRCVIWEFTGTTKEDAFEMSYQYSVRCNPGEHFIDAAFTTAWKIESNDQSSIAALTDFRNM